MSKLNNIKQIISTALTNTEIKYKEFILVSNEAENYRRHKYSIRIKDSGRGNIERERLIEHNKRVGVDEIIR